MFLPSGGHDHINQPKNSERLGSLYIDNDNQHKTSINVNTDDKGQILFNYFAGDVGCIMEIHVELTENGKKYSNKVNIIIKVPGLKCLSNNDAIYNKIGGLCQHHGPSDRSDVADSCKIDDHNHWGTETTINRLIYLANKWRKRYPDEAKLEFNDISIEFGGLDDVSGEWEYTTQGHETHRTGKYVDIRSHNMSPKDSIDDKNGNGVYDPPHLEVEIINGKIVVKRVDGDVFVKDYNGNGVYDTDMKKNFNNLVYQLYPAGQTLQLIEHGKNKHFHLQFNK